MLKSRLLLALGIIGGLVVGRYFRGFDDPCPCLGQTNMPAMDVAALATAMMMCRQEKEETRDQLEWARDKIAMLTKRPQARCASPTNVGGPAK